MQIILYYIILIIVPHTCPFVECRVTNNIAPYRGVGREGAEVGLKHPFGSGDCPGEMLNFEVFLLGSGSDPLEMSTPSGSILATPLP